MEKTLSRKQTAVQARRNSGTLQVGAKGRTCVRAVSPANSSAFMKGTSHASRIAGSKRYDRLGPILAIGTIGRRYNHGCAQASTRCHQVQEERCRAVSGDACVR